MKTYVFMQIYHKLQLGNIRTIYSFPCTYFINSLRLKITPSLDVLCVWFPKLMENAFIDQLSFHCWRETADSNKTATFQQFFDCKEPVLLSSFSVVLRVCGLVLVFIRILYSTRWAPSTSRCCHVIGRPEVPWSVEFLEESCHCGK